MSRLPNFFAIGEFYHLYNRGTDKRLIFNDDIDRNRFISLLYLCNSQSVIQRSNFTTSSLNELLNISRKEPLVDIGAYCIMSNHFHLLVHECIENGISIFMQKLSTAYTMYFNKRHERNGSLFQGRFKAKHLDSDNYLKYIFAYIHLNPVEIIDKGWKDHLLKNKSRTLKFLKSYSFSSYLDYLNEEFRNPIGKILNKNVFPQYFQTQRDFEIHINDWLIRAEENTVLFGKVEP